MGQKVVCHQEMVYNGIKRYKDEVFELQHMRNDYSLLNVGHVRPFDEAVGIELLRDDSGREFLSESARVRYRKDAPGDTQIKVKRGPGRPKGSRDSKPRQAVREIPDTAPVRI